MTPLGRPLSILLTACLLLSTAIGPAVALDTPTVTDDGNAAHGTHFLSTLANNTTVRQENPDRVNENGDVENMQSWLSGQLSSRLHRSSIELSRGEYEVAKQLVGEEYRDRYGQYVDVTGDTNGEGEDPSTFEQARQNQQTLATSLQEYRSTYEQYQRAKRNGDEARARQLARNLTSLATRVSNSSTELRSNLGTLSNQTQTDFTDAHHATQNVSRNVSEQQARVIEETFVRTAITASVADEQASFRDPLIVTGQVTTANGSTIAPGPAIFQVGERSIRSTIGSNGTFQLSYRPTTLSLNASSVIVRYVPADSSIYLGSNDSVPIAVSQVTPTVRVQGPADASYNDSMTITGSVGVGSQSAPNVSVVLSINGTRLGTARTAPNGEFTLSTSLPATVSTGTRDLNARFSLQNRALAPGRGTTPITIGETDTNLTSTAQRTGERIRISGTLRTADGEPVSHQLIGLSADGRPLTTAETDMNGSYVATIPLPPPGERSQNGAIAIRASFDGTGTNLAPATARSSVLFPGAGATSSTLFDRLLAVPWWLAVIALALVGTGASWIYARRNGLWRTDEATDTPIAPTRTRDAAATDPMASSRSLLASARDHFSKGQTERAVQTAYLAARTRLADPVEESQSLTHWELYERCEGTGLSDEQLDVLLAVTEAYEQATFAARTVPSDVASRILDSVSTLE